MHQFVFFTGGVVLLTLIINGSTTQFLLLFLKMDTITETKVEPVLSQMSSVSTPAGYIPINYYLATHVVLGLRLFFLDVY